MRENGPKITSVIQYLLVLTLFHIFIKKPRFLTQLDFRYKENVNTMAANSFFDVKTVFRANITMPNCLLTSLS